MRIAYPPGEKTLKKLEKIRTLRENDPSLSTTAIGKIIGIDQTYVSGLLRWDKEQREKKI